MTDERNLICTTGFDELWAELCGDDYELETEHHSATDDRCQCRSHEGCARLEADGLIMGAAHAGIEVTDAARDALIAGLTELRESWAEYAPLIHKAAYDAGIDLDGCETAADMLERLEQSDEGQALLDERCSGDGACDPTIEVRLVNGYRLPLLQPQRTDSALELLQRERDEQSAIIAKLYIEIAQMATKGSELREEVRALKRKLRERKRGEPEAEASADAESLPLAVRRALLVPAVHCEAHPDDAPRVAKLLHELADAFDRLERERHGDFEARIREAIEHTIALREGEESEAGPYELMAGLALLVCGIANGLRAEFDPEHPLYGRVHRKALAEHSWRAMQSILGDDLLRAGNPQDWLEGIGAVMEVPA